MSQFIFSGNKVFGSVKDGVFEKHIVEAKHLLWREGGVPAIDKRVWEKVMPTVTVIRIFTDKERVWSVTKVKFDMEKKEIDLGHGVQYVIPRKSWVVEPVTYQTKLF